MCLLRMMERALERVYRCVREVFKRAGVQRDVTVTATKRRKLFSSSGAEMSPTKKRAINAHTKHKESTADSNYVF